MTDAFDIGPAPLAQTDSTTPFSAAADVRRLTQSLWSSALVQAAVDLRLADLVGEGAVRLADLAEAAGAEPAALRRLLRALSAHGVFRRTGDDEYAHTPFSRCLASDAPGSVAHLVGLAGSDWTWTVWHRLADTVRTGEPAFRTAFGKDVYRYFAEDDPQAGAVFNRAMVESARWTSGPVLDALDLTGTGTVADVAGGSGSLLRLLLERHPKVSGVLIDAEQVLGQAEPALTQGPLAARCSLVPADIRKELPVAADLYLMRQVMHIWNDEECVQVLSHCASAAPPGARIVVVEHLLADGPRRDSTFSSLLDVQMMLLGTGRERTEREFAALFEAAGLRYEGVTRIPSPLQLITARAPG